MSVASCARTLKSSDLPLQKLSYRQIGIFYRN